MEIAYIRVGSGVPLVLLHAFPFSSEMWAAQRGGLSREADVITVDQRGFGDSAGPDAFAGTSPDLNVVAGDLAELLDRLALRDVVLGGLSMGGYVAMAFLRRHAERVRGLILANTKASADSPDAAANRLRIADAVEQAGHAELLAAELGPKLVSAESKRRDPELMRRVESMLRAAPPDAVAWAQRAMAARPDSFDVLRALEIPVLVVAGEQDALMPGAEAGAMVSAARTGELVVVPEAGHLTALETPREFNTAVSGFLKQFS
ncbi:MAG TPA: alpha/beta hydrolase [Micromonosporaceae bacterium]|nr:alpha/beta hydrolase [Micromonosporaceae bacterium]